MSQFLINYEKKSGCFEVVEIETMITILFHYFYRYSLIFFQLTILLR
jgi:hypothetical protein